MSNQPLFTYLLRLGDDALIHSYRVAELCSRGPFLEEDLALTNISLDFMGRAQALLRYAGEMEGAGRTEDDLAYRRPEKQFYNHLITEMPNGNFAETVARGFYVAAYEQYVFEQLQQSNDATIAAIAAKTLKEVHYHLSHFRDWVLRLGDGTDESHTKMQNAINELWMFTGELFESDETDEQMLHTGIGVDLLAIKVKWMNYVDSVLNEATLTMPGFTYMQTGSRRGNHTEHLGHILSEMQYLQRAYPDAKW